MLEQEGLAYFRSPQVPKLLCLGRLGRMGGQPLMVERGRIIRKPTSSDEFTVLFSLSLLTCFCSSLWSDKMDTKTLGDNGQHGLVKSCQDLLCRMA